MIRQVLFPLQDRDVEAIRRLGSEFTKEVGFAFDADWAVAQVSGILNSGIGSMWFLEANEVVGMICGVIVPSLYDGETEIVELFWFVSKDYRHGLEPIRLFKQLEMWGNQLKVKRIRFMHLERSMPDKLQKLYEQSGFKLMEKVYSKELR